MKQCPNPNCIIYTRLDELPDTYLRCPQCYEPLVEAVPATRFLASGYLADEATALYDPALHSPQYVQQPLTYEEEPYDDYDYGEFDEGDVEPPQTPQASRLGWVRSAGAALGALALIAACLALVLTVGNRLFPRFAASGGASAQQTAVSSARLPVNTPIISPPTIPLSGVGGRMPEDTGTPPGPSSSALVLDALMCARLEGGQPVGLTGAYRPGDPFNLAVQAEFGPGGVTTVLTRWYGPGGALIYEMPQSYSQKGTYYAGFTLSKDAPWPTGDYRVDIYANNSPQPARSVSFSVVPP